MSKLIPEAARVTESIYAAPIFSREECERIISCARLLPGWHPSDVLSAKGRVRSAVRSSENITLASLDDEQIAQSELRPLLSRLQSFALATDQRTLQLGSRQLQEIQFVRYQPGDVFRWHVDSHHTDFRKVSLLCYLDDASSNLLAGGETCFASPRFQPLLEKSGIQGALWRRLLGSRVSANWVEQPQAGRALVFPSRRMHCGRPVLSGEKNVIAMFFV